MKAVKKIEFTADLVLERSITSYVQPLGKHKCSMELYTETGKTIDTDCGDIEWIYGLDTDNEDVVNIGIWWKGRTLDEYDGVFNLPKQAISLLRKCGIIVPKEFER